MTDRIRGRLICEDRRQEAFFRHLLEPIFRNRLDVRISPSGDGAASAWVVKQYPVHVREWVRRRPTERIALVTVVDGDNIGTAGRVIELAQALTSANESARTPTERIAICVPTWSVETWLLHLGGTPNISESVSLKVQYERGGQGDLASLADALRDAKTSPLPSMQAAITELVRVRS